jgi:cytochrome c-type biogenesis protein CcmH/NrfG
MQAVRNLVGLPINDADVRRFCADVFVEVGIAMQRSGDTCMALDLLAEALKACPQHDVALFEMGVIAMAQGNQADAIALYQHSAMANPANVPVCLLIARSSSTNIPSTR